MIRYLLLILTVLKFVEFILGALTPYTLITLFEDLPLPSETIIVMCNKIIVFKLSIEVHLLIRLSIRRCTAVTITCDRAGASFSFQHFLCSIFFTSKRLEVSSGIFSDINHWMNIF